MNPKKLSAYPDHNIYLNRSSPAVANHAHPLRLGLSVELGALLEILLASDGLCVAETCLCQSIDVTPSCEITYQCCNLQASWFKLTPSDLKASQCKRLVLLNAPPIHVANAQLIDA